MNSSSPGSSAPPQSAALRSLRASDRAPLEAILRATQVFQPYEIDVALELIDAPASSGYRFVVAELEGAGSDGRVAGYACFGKTPCTDGTWDLYWIAVDPTLHGAGIGWTLMRATEEAVRADHGRMIVIETASKPAYDRTRAFYLKYGCREVARVPDFYSLGDDKVVYALTLQ